jgi:hypothetical protein
MARRALSRAITLALVTGLPAAAQSTEHRVGAMLDSLHAGVARFHPTGQGAAAWTRVLDSLTTVVDEARARDVTVEQLVRAARQEQTWRDIARRRRNENYSPSDAVPPRLSVGLRQAHVGLRGLFVATGAQTAAIDSVLTPTRELQESFRGIAAVDAESRLNRYEIKYGPGSPPLNGIEVLANYALQWIPGFGPGPKGPGPLELVAAYSTSGATAEDGSVKSLRLVSGTRVGLRVYDFSGRNAKSIVDALRPTEFSFGWAGIAGENAPLQAPLARTLRGGGFVGLGPLYAALTVVRGRQLVIGASRQLVPYVF